MTTLKVVMFVPQGDGPGEIADKASHVCQQLQVKLNGFSKLRLLPMETINVQESHADGDTKAYWTLGTAPDNNADHLKRLVSEVGQVWKKRGVHLTLQVPCPDCGGILLRVNDQIETCDLCSAFFERRGAVCLTEETDSEAKGNETEPPSTSTDSGTNS